jgi:uncharacterized protein
MMRRLILAALFALALPPAPARAQPAPQAVAGTRLDVVATGEVTRVPDIVRINAGVVSQAATASEAIRQNSARMARVRAALRRAGIADRDIQTTNISLQPDYRYAENQPPQLTGYRASNEVNVRFRDIANSGAILDALVAEGANQINGPMPAIEHPEAALDEARTRALAAARARAELYARSLGMRVARIVAVSEAGAAPPMPVPVMRLQAADAANARIDPGEQVLSASLTVTFELQ